MTATLERGAVSTPAVDVATLDSLFDGSARWVGLNVVGTELGEPDGPSYRRLLCRFVRDGHAATNAHALKWTAEEEWGWLGGAIVYDEDGQPLAIGDFTFEGSTRARSVFVAAGDTINLAARSARFVLWRRAVLG